MNIRSKAVLLALLAAGGWAAAPAQDVSAPAPAPAAAPPTPVPAAAPQKTSDICCSDGGDDEPQTKRHPIPLEASWDYGFRIHSQDDDFRLHVGGIVQVDTVWLIGPQSVFALPGGGTNGVGNAEATQLRRTILEMDGTIFGFFDFMVEYDFANASNDNSGLQPPSFGNLTSSPAPLNIWMQARELPYLGNVRVGNQVKTIGLENNTSAPFLPFMERSDNMDAFYGPFDNGYSLGIAANNWTESERITWRYGVFQPATNVFGVALNKYVVGARVTALPWYEGDGDRLIHLGLGYEGGELVQDELRDRARPLLRNAPGFAVPVFVDTGEVPGSKQYTIAPEFALQYGPLLVEAEYAAQLFTDAIASDGQNQGTVFYHGGYVEALYFLTGEHQDYVRRAGAFGRVVPRNDLKWKKDDGFSGCGAWQVGVRFSYLDLDDKAIQGGKVYDWTAGLNWYLNPNMKVQLNYVVEHRDTPGVTPGWINGVGLRAAYDF